MPEETHYDSWQAVVSDFQENEKRVKEEEENVVVPLGEGRPLPPERKLGPMYEMFADLPAELQDQILAEINALKEQKKEPKEIIERVNQTVQKAKEMMGLEGGKPEESGPEQDKLKDELEDIHGTLQKIRSDKEKKSEESKDADGKQTTKKAWIN